ncbi:MAG: cation diffusion facilitator family transporter, partial [Senegalia sp. (in: firmicutes)]
MDNNYKEVSKTLWIILFANFLVAIVKILVGNIVMSASLIADGFHSFADGSSNIAGLIGIKFASKPTDKEHPYGYEKFELLSSLFISGMLFFISGNIVMDAFKKLFNPTELNISSYSIIAIILTLIINIIVASLEYKKGKKLNSNILISDSMHTKSDIFVSLGVLFTLISISLGLPNIIDPIASFIVAGFIIKAAIEIFISSSRVLVDKKALDTRKVRKVLDEYLEIKGVHNIRSRSTGKKIFLDLHMLLA